MSQDNELAEWIKTLEAPPDTPCDDPYPHPGHLWSRIHRGGFCPGLRGVRRTRPEETA